jgi:hypothetical protein
MCSSPLSIVSAAVSVRPRSPRCCAPIHSNTQRIATHTRRASTTPRAPCATCSAAKGLSALQAKGDLWQRQPESHRSCADPGTLRHGSQSVALLGFQAQEGPPYVSKVTALSNRMATDPRLPPEAQSIGAPRLQLPLPGQSRGLSRVVTPRGALVIRTLRKSEGIPETSL